MEDDEAVDSKSTDLIGLFDCQFDVRRTFAEAGTLDVFALHGMTGNHSERRPSGRVY